MSILVALLSALCNAASLLTQRVSSRAGPKGWRLVLYLLKDGLWLLGIGLALGSFLLQAYALHLGKLSVVQPVLVTELIFVLVLRWVWLHQPVRLAAWGSAALTCLGLGVFIAVAEPRGGHSSPTSSAWAWAIAVFGGVGVLTTLLGRSGSPVRRTAMYATASGVLAGLEAAFMKTATHTLSVDGVGAMFTDWPVWALAVSGIASTVLVQAALHVGPLTVSQPLMAVVNPVVSIALSIWLFDEVFTDNPAAIAFAALAFAALVAGVILLARTGPQGGQQPSHRSKESPRRPAPAASSEGG